MFGYRQQFTLMLGSRQVGTERFVVLSDHTLQRVEEVEVGQKTLAFVWRVCFKIGLCVLHAKRRFMMYLFSMNNSLQVSTFR